MKAVTKKNINEIAQLAGVSTATVSRVIHNAECVKPKTREKVLRIIEECNYIPSETARGLSTKKSNAIGVVFPDLKNPFYYGLLRGITNVAEKNGYSVLMFYTDENTQKEKEILKVAKGRDLAGLIITAVGVADPETAALLKSYEAENIPVILLDRQLEGQNFCTVLAENEEGSYQAVKQLIREGHRKIALIEGDPHLNPVHERCLGFKRAMEECGVEIRPEYIIRANQMAELAYEKMRDLLALPDPPTAVFSTNNMTTLGVLRCITERHIKIGEDISIIGFDDIEILNDIDYKLSVVDRSERQMGEAAMNALLLRFEGRTEEAYNIERIPARLILRGSEKINLNKFKTAKAF